MFENIGVCYIATMAKSELTQVLEVVTFIKDKVEQHDERFDHIDEELQAIRSEASSVRADLNLLEKKIENYSGPTKEVDHALLRTRVIEKRLGAKIGY